MFSPICLTNFSQFEQLKKKANSLLVQNSFFLSLPVEKEIIINVCRKYLEFEINEFVKSLALCAKVQKYKRAKYVSNFLTYGYMWC